MAIIQLEELYDGHRLALRLAARTEKTDGCWLWRGATVLSNSKWRYGSTTLLREDGIWRNMLAHRAAFLVDRGFIDTKLLVCHTCDNTLCVRPDHLFQATYKQNMDDMYAKGRNRHAPFHGERNPAAILDEKRVLEIRAIYDFTSKKYGLRKRLREHYGISRSQLDAIVERRSWTHLP